MKILTAPKRWRKRALKLQKRFLALIRLYFSVGRWGERIAQKYLEKSYYVRHSNWRCRAGEIDLVVQDRYTLVFVEVKTRILPRTRDFDPLEAATEKKLAKIGDLARIYQKRFAVEIRRRRLNKVRFDVIGVYAKHHWYGREAYKICHLRNVA